MSRYGVKINFAHRTFSWASEAPGKAHVHVVIIGFALADRDRKKIYDYAADADQPTVSVVKNISPYLIDGADSVIAARATPLGAVSSIVNGSIPADGGNLLFDENEKTAFIAAEPAAKKWIRPYLGAETFLHGIARFCLWLKDCPPEELRRMPLTMKRVAAVRTMRLASAKEATRKKAETPSRFTEDRQPKSGNYLAFPRTSSETRKYIPIGFLSAGTIAANDLQIIPSATLYEFGVLTSTMHMAWMKITSGRLESRFRYSVKFTYNTFPWPSSTAAQRTKIETVAQAVLIARAQYPTSTLADLYDPLTMPPPLVKAHTQLDAAVDRAYRQEKFPADRQRLEHLFTLHQQLTSPLTITPKKKRGR
jgi:hypothetical protein